MNFLSFPYIPVLLGLYLKPGLISRDSGARSAPESRLKIQAYSWTDLPTINVITLLLLHPLKQTPIQVWPFANESIIRVGRSTDNDVVLYSAVVSRRHVELRKVGDVWDIVNLGTNGTYVEGKRIEKITVQDGTVIRLARSGPNIQIRLGSDTLKDLPEHLIGHRPSSSQNVQHTKITEMTDPLRRDDAEGEKTRHEGYHLSMILAQS